MADDLVAPLIVLGDDVLLFGSLEEMTTTLEGVDVAEREYRAFGATGRRIALGTRSVRRHRFSVDVGTVHVAGIEAAPTGAEELRLALIEYLHACGDAVSGSANLAVLVTAVQARAATKRPVRAASATKTIVLVVAGIVASSTTIAVLRQMMAVPFIPRSAREIVVTLSDLPLPLFVDNVEVIEDCAGLFCMDFHSRGIVRLDPDACRQALDVAKARGWAPLPVAGPRSVTLDDRAVEPPARGYYRFEHPTPRDQLVMWIDADDCRVLAEALDW